MSATVVRRLRPSDAPAITDLVGPAYSARTLARELSSEAEYLWMGTVGRDGELCAMHRSMRWGNHLLLKGIFVREDLRGGGTALELVFGLREEARRAGFAGLVAWAEPHQPETVMARLLRLRIAGPLLHRFEVPAAAGAAELVPDDAAARADSGVLRFDSASPRTAQPLLPCVLDAEIEIRWVVDRHRLVVSGYPFSSIADLPEFVRALGPLVRSKDLRSIEIPLPAADLSTALGLVGAGARRLSRTPVRVGRLDFAHTSGKPHLDAGEQVSRR